MELNRAQKIVLIVGLLLLVVGLVLWLVLRRPLVPALVPAPPPAGTPPAGLPTAGPAVPRPGEVPTAGGPGAPAISGEAAAAPTGVLAQGVRGAHLGSDGALYFYKPTDGYFYRLTPGGTPEKITDQAFVGAKSVLWSDARDRAIVSFPDGANILYDAVAKRQVVLPRNWSEFSFAPSGEQMVFKILNSDPDKRWLAVASADGSQVRAFQPLGRNADKVTVSWSPTGQIAGWFTEAKDIDRQEVYFLGFQGENFRSMLVEGYQPIGKWSPSGQRLLYSVVDPDPATGYPPTLWVVEAAGDKIGLGRLRLPVETWANKCLFVNENTVYCAVPRQLPMGAGFEPNKAVAGDDLYQIDLVSGTKSPIVLLGGQHVVISDLLLSHDGKTIYFVDQGSGNLHQVSTNIP